MSLGSVRGRRRSGRRRPGMEAHHRPGVGARLEQAVPVAGVERREPEALRQLGKGDGAKAMLGVAPHFEGAHLGIEQPGQLARDDTPRVGSRPLLEVPVVGGPDHRQRELRIAHAELVSLPGEAGEGGREVERGVHAVDVHVRDASVDVPGATAHLVESRRLEGELVDWPADHRVEPDLVVAVAVVGPVLHPVVVLEDPRSEVGVPGGDPPLEQASRLDQMVVDRDQGAPPGPPRWLGQERRPLRTPLSRRPGGEEPRTALERIEADPRPCCHSPKVAVDVAGRPRQAGAVHRGGE